MLTTIMIKTAVAMGLTHAPILVVKERMRKKYRYDNLWDLIGNEWRYLVAATTTLWTVALVVLVSLAYNITTG